MRYRKQHKQRTYQRILQSARRLFVSQGYASTSIDEIMLDCGLTRGGFYAHFDSKSQLYREAMHDADAVLVGNESEVDILLKECLQAARATFLATDIASEEQDVRAAYSQAFQRLCQRLECATRGARDEQIAAAAAAIVGTLAVVHTTDDAELKQRILRACNRQVPAFLAEHSSDDPPHFFWAPCYEDVFR